MRQRGSNGGEEVNLEKASEKLVNSVNGAVTEICAFKVLHTVLSIVYEAPLSQKDQFFIYLVRSQVQFISAWLGY